MSYRRLFMPGLFLVALCATSVLLLSGLLTSSAVQNPSMSFDMVTTGNTYTPGDDQNADGFPDPGTNQMTVGTINNCLTTAAPGNNVQHSHTAHLIIQNVEDMVGWQVRLNYLGDQFRPTAAFNTRPFSDSFTGDVVGFTNLPLDGAPPNLSHRGVVDASSIPPPAAGPQTALIGSVYGGAQTFAVSPDTPQKATHDETNQTYGTTGGGILATMNLTVAAGLAGQPSLFINMDDGSPNPPGSAVVVFDGMGTQTIEPPAAQLGDAFHGEGISCDGNPPPSPCSTPGATAPPINISDETFTNQLGQSASDLHARYTGPVVPCLLVNAPGCPAPTVAERGESWDVVWGFACVDNGESVTVRVTSEPPASRTCSDWTLGIQVIGPANPPSCFPPTPSPSPPPVAGHDARLSRIGGVPKNVRLSPGGVIANESANIVVANDSNHTETIGVYADATAPAVGDCRPNGRVLDTTVTLAAGDKTTITVFQDYFCTDPSAADGLSYTWTAVADHGADDLSSCGPGSLQSIACFNALANDDEDPADSRKSRTGPKVIAQ